MADEKLNNALSDNSEPMEESDQLDQTELDQEQTEQFEPDEELDQPEQVEENLTDVGGNRAVEVFYRGIREIETGTLAYFQSKTRLNTPGLGILMPETFRDVAELSNQCLTLFEMEFGQVLEAAKKFKERDFFYKWVSVYMPPNYLLERGAEQKLLNTIEENDTDCNRICFELPLKILSEGTVKHARVIENLRNRGFHFMLTGFGGNDSPLMKLSDYPVDFVMLSQEITTYIGKNERSNAAVHSVVSFVDGLGADAIADGVSTANQAEAFFEADCRYIAGNLAGKYTLAQYIRKRNNNTL